MMFPKNVTIGGVAVQGLIGKSKSKRFKREGK